MNLDAYLPRLNLETVEFLKKIITSNSLIFETGTGNSTIWFGKQAKKVVAIESDSSWYEKVRELIRRENLQNVRLYFDPKYPEKEFHDILEKEDVIQYDIVLHDGPFDANKRIVAMKFIHLFVKPGGYLIVDDTRSLSMKNGMQKYLDCLDWERFNIPCGKDAYGSGKSAAVYRNKGHYLQ